MNKYINIPLIGIIIAFITLFFGDNLYEQSTGQPFFQNIPTITPISISIAIPTTSSLSVVNTPISSPTTDIPFNTITGAWEGKWTNPSGDLFTCEITFNVSQSNNISGNIIWTLVKSRNANSKSGLTGTEYIIGTYDPKIRLATFDGYKKEDPHNVIGLDEYRLSLSNDGHRLEGVSKNGGDWQGEIIAHRKP